MVEPVSITAAAIVAALTAGVSAGVGKVGENVIADAYQGLKGLLKRKFGENSEVVKAAETIEEDPGSEWRKGMLEEKAKVAGVDQDPEVRRVAEELLEQLKAQPGGEQHVQNAIGSYIAQADRGSTATVSIDRPEDERV